MYEHYKPLHQQSIKTEFAIRNAFDNPHSTESYQMMRMMKDYRTGLERGEHARTLEARARSMEMFIHQNQQRNPNFMSQQDANRFRQHFRDTIDKGIRKLPHY